LTVSESEKAEQVNTFLVDGQYLFKHYFDGDAVFDRLQPFYNNSQYRFEVPADAFEDLRSFLADHGYELVVVDAVGKFVVVVESYTAHPENIFKESVLQHETGSHNYFLMTDQFAVARATGECATRLGETDLDNPFDSSTGD
jgi:hypothetical protein